MFLLLTGIVGVFGFDMWWAEEKGVTEERASPWVQEAGSMQESSNEDWWVNSGAYIAKTENGFQTVQGELSLISFWRIRYFLANPTDTDNGSRPQNIFRLVGRDMWENGEQTVYFRIRNINISKSPERDAWSGIFLFQRYQDGDNLYYAGVRQDGAVVIKKKTKGIYYTMAYVSLYGNGVSYNKNTNPNLIPGMKWIGLRVLTQTKEDGTVSLRLLIDQEGNGNWEGVLEAVDDGQKYGGEPIAGQGHGGIRSDFMDMEFRDYAWKTI